MTIGANKSVKDPDEDEVDVAGDVTYTDSHDKVDKTCEQRIPESQATGGGIPLDCRGATKDNGWNATIPWNVDVGTPLSPVTYKVEGDELGNAFFSFGGNRILKGGVGLNYDAGLGSFTVKGGAAGWVSLSNGNFNIEGDAKACMLFGQLCLNGDALASKVGIEACATVIPPVNFGLFRTPSLRAGAAMRWGDSPSFMAPSCDIGGFRVDISTGRRRARADGPVGTAVTVPTGAKIEVLRFNGDGKTTPRVRLYGPGGAVLDEQLPGQTLDFTKSFMIGDPQNHDVLAMLVQPAAGAWTAVALDNTTISSVDGAQDLPRPQVTGEVSQLPNGKQQLSYSFVPRTAST